MARAHTGAGLSDSGDVSQTGFGASEASRRTERKPYEAPRIERRIPIIANTLASGGECIFPGDPCDS